LSDNSVKMDRELINLGLSPSEAKVYLAILRLGQASVTKISEQANVKRPTTYLALEDLMRQGLVSEVRKGKIMTFKVESPNRLSRLTRKMRRKVITAELGLEEVLPNLKALQKRILTVPQVIFHEGKIGVRHVLEDLTASTETWYFFGSSEEIIKKMSSQELDELLSETGFLREQAGRPKACIITDKGIFSLKPFQNKKIEVREIKVLTQPIKNTAAFCVYGNRVGIFSVSESPFGAIIESEETADLVRTMFKIIWDSLK